MSVRELLLLTVMFLMGWGVIIYSHIDSWQGRRRKQKWFTQTNGKAKPEKKEAAE
jgi:hypothetical protein